MTQEPTKEHFDITDRTLSSYNYMHCLHSQRVSALRTSIGIQFQPRPQVEFVYTRAIFVYVIKYLGSFTAPESKCFFLTFFYLYKRQIRRKNAYDSYNLFGATQSSFCQLKSVYLDFCSKASTEPCGWWINSLYNPFPTEITSTVSQYSITFLNGKISYSTCNTFQRATTLWYRLPVPLKFLKRHSNFLEYIAILCI